jgi:hypothetical protein
MLAGLVVSTYVVGDQASNCSRRESCNMTAILLIASPLSIVRVVRSRTSQRGVIGLLA